MKPIIIYTTERSRSTAVLQASKRNLLLNEPFDAHSVLGSNPMQDHGVKSIFDIRKKLLELTDWNTIKHNMSQSDSATKFFGTGLSNYYPAQHWFREICESNSHEIFVLLRNLTEVLTSLFIANHFGFSKEFENDPYEFTVKNDELVYAGTMIDSFLEFYPKNAKTITFNSLPDEFFDYTKIMSVDQKSNEKLQYINNLEYVLEQIYTLLYTKQARWQDITGTEIFTNW